MSRSHQPGTYTSSNTAFANGTECQFTPKSDKPFYLETPCNHFAKFCYLITKGSIDRYVDNVGEDLNPIVAFGHFLLSGQQSIIGIDRWDDPTILKLYSIAKDGMDNSTHVNTKEEITSIKTICKATHDQFEKISKNIASNPERAYKYSEPGRIYSDTLKRKYDQLGESSTSDESITPMEEPDDITPLPPVPNNHLYLQW